MTVYLVPAAAGRYELYCESPAPAPGDDAREGSLWRRLVDGFRRMVEEGEAERDGRLADVPDRGRFRRLITRRVAEAVAEQRLLWHLRQEQAATLVHPDDVNTEQALSLSRRLLTTDCRKHRRWLLIDAAIAAVTGPALFFVPGPNILSWYFAFRAVGHYFAMRGARQGLSAVVWTGSPSAALTELRGALTLDAEARAAVVERIASTLGLDRLGFFIARVA